MLSRTVDRVALAGEGIILLLGRVLIGTLFVPAGYGHLTGLTGFAQYLGSQGLPVPMAWAIVGAVIEFFGGLAIVVGFKTRHAALLLTAFTLIAALLSHSYWAADAAAYRNQFIHFYKNIAIVGGLLFVFVRGAGPLSIDRR
jgi:putative oxidoreductase